MRTHPRLTRRTFLASATAAAALLAQRNSWASLPDNTDAGSSNRDMLHFKQPAAKWPDALPVGNGRLGAVVFGNTAIERIQLNEESIWDGEPNRDRNNPRAGVAVPRIRELLFAGQIAEAEQLATADMLSLPQRMPCYQTLGDLHLDFTGMGLTPDTEVEGYRLQLDLDSAIVTTTFTYRGTRYNREVFASAPDQVIVIRMTAKGPGKLHLKASLDRPGNHSVAALPNGHVALSGQALPVNDNPGSVIKEHQTGVRFYAELMATQTGGSLVQPQNDPQPSIVIANADEITLLLDCATSYGYPARTGKTSGVDAAVLTGDLDAMHAAVAKNLSTAARHTYNSLRERHMQDHRRFFRRAAIDFGPDPNANIPTDQRVLAVKHGGEDIHLIPLYFQYGRYMLISSSRPGTLAANLQGIWNESIDPPWGSKYTVNINTEMNYWLAERANLSECHLPLFDLISTTRQPGAKTAMAYYKAQGSVVHHNTDLWGDAGPIDGLGGGIWPMGGAWLSLHAWDHYEYTGDVNFLRERGYLILREHALFLLDYLVRDPHTGKLTTGPSCSPENKYKLPSGKSYNLCMGPTMDISIVRAVLSRLLEASAVVSPSADHDLLERARTSLAQLPPFQVGHDGRLQEWQTDYADEEPGHRHVSHLFGLFPEDQISVQATPSLARAARATLKKRLANGGGSTGWSRSWIINCMARLGDGEAAYASVLELFRHAIRPNFFDVCGMKENSPFQIDGNLGGPTGFIEMLLQSHGHTSLEPAAMNASEPADANTQVLRLLPALPKAWPQGRVRGLRARGGVEVNFTWKDGRVVEATLHTSISRSHIIALPPDSNTVHVTSRGKTIHTHSNAHGVLLQARAGESYHLRFA